MRILLLAICPLFLGCATAAAAPDDTPLTAPAADAERASPGNPSADTLQAEILRMDEEDAAGRSALVELHPESAAFREAVARLAESDSARAARLEAVVHRRGLPLPREVGEKAFDAFLFLTLRASRVPALQDDVLRLLRRSHREGEVSGSRYAIFADQLRMMRDEPQIYGTQLLFDLETGSVRPYRIEDEDRVDARRAAIGLGPLDDYLRRMRSRVEGS